MTDKQAATLIMNIIIKGQHERTAEKMQQAYRRKYAEWFKAHLAAAKAQRTFNTACKAVGLKVFTQFEYGTMTTDEQKAALAELALAADLATIDARSLKIDLYNLETAYRKHINRYKLHSLPYNIYD